MDDNPRDADAALAAFAPAAFAWRITEMPNSMRGSPGVRRSQKDPYHGEALKRHWGQLRGMGNSFGLIAQRTSQSLDWGNSVSGVHVQRMAIEMFLFAIRNRAEVNYGKRAFWGILLLPKV
jgi:hypothetical protein